MPDTISEPVNVTLDDSNLGSGEHTILTTDANTAYVIRDVFVEAENLDTLTLDVNGVPAARIRNGASGSEIVAPNSTVKVKSPDFPLTYDDLLVTYYANDNTMGAVDVPLVNSRSDGSLVSEENYALTPHNASTTHVLTQVHYHAPTGNRVLLERDRTAGWVEISNSAGASLLSNTTAYAAPVYDGSRYVYWNDGGGNIDGWDVQTGVFLSNLLSGVTNGSVDAQAAWCVPRPGVPRGAYLYCTGSVSTPTYYLVTDFDTSPRIFQLGQTGTDTSLLGGGDLPPQRTAETFVLAHAEMTAQDRVEMYFGTASGVEHWEVSFDYDRPNINGTVRWRKLDDYALVGNVSNAINLGQFSVIDGRIYFADRNVLMAYSIADGVVSEVTPLANFPRYGVSVSKTAPDQATIDGRTYLQKPSAKLRMTGIRST